MNQGGVRMKKDRVIPIFMAVCLFYVSGKLLSLCLRSGPLPYVIAAAVSLVLGYVCYRKAAALAVRVSSGPHLGNKPARVFLQLGGKLHDADFWRNGSARDLLYNWRQAIFPAFKALAGELKKERGDPLLIFLPFCRIHGP